MIYSLFWFTLSALGNWLSFSTNENIQDQLRRAERRNRDAFRTMMEGHVASGILTAKIYWRDYCAKVTFKQNLDTF